MHITQYEQGHFCNINELQKEKITNTRLTTNSACFVENWLQLSLTQGTYLYFNDNFQHNNIQDVLTKSSIYLRKNFLF